ncbi:MAG: trigger factor [Bacteroidales bacterium]|nr:trigger factor [Bacteroidales bacterium]MCF8454526.1 trigger factor [Bacteroidales bacterium]
MELTTENIGHLESIIKIQITAADYLENVNNSLKDYRKKVDLKGFRKGMVPMGVVKKMVGKAILGEEINKLVSKGLTDFLQKGELNILGEPLPSLKEQTPIDWDTQSDFEFVFDVGLAPEFEVKLSFDEDHVPYYVIQVTNEMIDDQVEKFKQQFGEMNNQDVVEKESGIIGDLVELDDEGNVKEGGIEAKDAKLLVRLVKDEEIQNSLIGANQQQIISFNLRNAFPNDTEISSMLGIDKEAAADLNSDFQLTIKEISKYVHGEVDQKLFDQVYGEGTVNSEEEFRAKIKENIANSLVKESDFKFQIDMKEYLMNKFQFDLPAEFLKRWLLEVNEDLKRDELEKDWPLFEKDFKWQMISSKISDEKEIKVSEEDLKEEAKRVARNQFMQYGMGNLPDENLEEFAKYILDKEEDRKKMATQIFETKIFGELKNMVQLDKQDISDKDFMKMFEQKPEIDAGTLQLDEEALAIESSDEIEKEEN